jgi:hypothetical protein
LALLLGAAAAGAAGNRLVPGQRFDLKRRVIVPVG